MALRECGVAMDKEERTMGKTRKDEWRSECSERVPMSIRSKREVVREVMNPQEAKWE